MNVNLTDEQVKNIENTTKTYGFANRSEFLRALLRYVYNINPTLIKDATTSPFGLQQIEKKLPTLQEIKKAIIPILKKNDVEFAGIFGSYARGEAKSDSDIDILIRFKNDARKSLFDLSGLQNDLTNALGRKADLGTDIQTRVKPNVAKDLIVFYGQRRDI